MWEHTLATFAHRKKPDLVLSLALLLHDMGKPDAEGAGEKRFDGHSEIGARLATRFLRRLGFSARDRAGGGVPRALPHDAHRAEVPAPVPHGPGAVLPAFPAAAGGLQGRLLLLLHGRGDLLRGLQVLQGVAEEPGQSLHRRRRRRSRGPPTGGRAPPTRSARAGSSRARGARSRSWWRSWAGRGSGRVARASRARCPSPASPRPRTSRHGPWRAR